MNRYKFKLLIRVVIVFSFSLFLVLGTSCGDDNANNIVPPKPDPKPGNKTDTKPEAAKVDLSKYFIPIGKFEEDTRPFMECVDYGEDVIKAINDSLSSAISSVKTKREKAVVAAKFIVSFKSVIPYAYELADVEHKYAAKYLRKGLFISPIEDGGHTYKPWGCDVSTPSDPNSFPKNRFSNLGYTYKTGLHCSSFIGWCLLNAGVADAALLQKTYADNYKNFPLSELVSLESGKDSIMPGDLLYFKGHVAMVIDVDGDIVTFAESAIWASNHMDKRNGSRWRKFNRKTIDYKTFRFKSLIKMEGAYKI